MNYDPRKAIRQAMMIARREVTAPNKASIKGQRHILAYITPYEAELLMRRGGSGRLTEYGVPAFDDGDGDGDGPGGGDTSNADPGTQSAGAGNEGTGAGPTGAGIGGIGQDSQDDVGGPPGPPGGPNSGFGSSMSQDPENTQAAANMNTAVSAQQQGYGVGIADTGGVAPTGFGAAPGIGEALDAYDKGIIGLNQALGYAALSAFSPPGLEFGTVTDEVGNQAVGGRGNIGGAIGGIAGMASGVPGAGTVGGMIGSQVADALGVPSQTFSFADGGAVGYADGGIMNGETSNPSPLHIKNINDLPQAEKGYVYHMTSHDRLHDIYNDEQLRTHSPSDYTDQETWPDGGEEKRAYFARNPESTIHFAPEGKPALIRTRENSKMKVERGTGDIYSRDPIRAEHIDYLHENGSWKPLKIKRDTGGEITPPRDLGGDPTVQQALNATAPFSVSNPMAVFPKPQRMWEDQRPGGAYLSMPTKEDITGHKAAQAEIGVQPGGKPYFNVSKDAIEQTGSPGRGSATVKTNLFKQKAGWKWAQAPEGHENTSTLVSVEHRGKHHYALNTQFPKGVDLARYEDAPSEPRLRPTTKGNVELGEQVGTILVRGKEHPVYRNVIVRNAGGAVGYADGGMPGDDPTVQQALDITRQVQPEQSPIPGAMQVAQTVTAPGRRRFEIAPARVAPMTIDQKDRDLPEEGSVTIKRLTDAFKRAIDNHLSLPPAQQIANARQAENNVAQYVGRGKTGKINSVLTANKKLMKAQTAGEDDTPLTLPDGRTLEMTGLALMPDYREGQFKMCGNSDVCRDLCLGKESGQYRYDPTATQAQMPTTKEELAAAGGKPRMAAFRRTQAMMRDPESFAVYLHELIDGAKIMAEKRGAHLGVRLNVLSDLSPKIMEPIIKAHPEVSFYDYTKMNYDPVADNHHYTYSSTGLSQPDRGVENPYSNWRKLRDRLDQGHNVAMAFAHGKSDAFPEHLHDEETGKKYRVVSGDEHDFRPMDMVPEGEDGVIIALKNMAASNSEYKYENAAKNSHGFFVHHEPDFLRNNRGTFARDENGNRISRNKVYTVRTQPMKRGAVRQQEN